MTDEERITLLRKRIQEYNDAYYKGSESMVSDQVYDKLVKELEALEKQHPELATKDSPTQKVGDDRKAGFVSKPHSIPMLSLENTYNLDEAVKFMEDVNAQLGGPQKYAVEYKIDGLSISLRYEFGVLTQALTRGDGLQGDDVLQNILTIPEIPPRIVFPGATPTIFEVRGEVFMTYEDFLLLNEERERCGEPLFANPRNAASGTLKTLDKDIVKARRLHALFYGLGEIDPPLDIKTQQQMYSLFKTMGIPYEGDVRCVTTREELEKAIQAIGQSRATNPIYPVDGAVIKLNDFALRKKLGETAKAPRWAKAYKYEPEQAKTNVTNIAIQVGRTGTLTPVAEFEPVSLSGSTVSRATLHNEDFIRDFQLGIGDEVVVEKAGEIIPAVVMVHRKPGTVPFNFSEALKDGCPVCHQPAIRLPGMADWRCQNPDCPARLARSIEHLASRDALDIDGIGHVTAEMLVGSHTVKRLVDLFRVNWIDLCHTEKSKDGSILGPATADRIMESIRTVGDKPLSRWLYGLGIEGVGLTTARALAREYVSLRNFVDNFKPNPSIIRTRIAEFLTSEAGNTMLRTLLELGYDPVEVVASTPFTGKRIAFHGSFKTMDRTELAQRAVAAGAHVVLSVTKATDYLVAGEDRGQDSQKMRSARHFGIPIITEEDFIQMSS